MNQILSEIRKEYDVIAAKNRDEAEMWYKVIFLSYQKLLNSQAPDLYRGRLAILDLWGILYHNSDGGSQYFGIAVNLNAES